jgi:serine/threonine protein kinase
MRLAWSTRRRWQAMRKRAGARTTCGIGSVINDRFVIEGILGRGGMGVVYRARDLRKEETGDRDPFVALKVLSDEFRRDPRMVIALQRESRKAQTLAHPNIATVYDFDRDGDIVYLTMEELDGQPLNDVIREHPWVCRKPRRCRSSAA